MLDPRMRVVMLAGGAIAAAALVLAILVLGFGARLDAPTIALAVVAAARVASRSASRVASSGCSVAPPSIARMTSIARRRYVAITVSKSPFDSLPIPKSNSSSLIARRSRRFSSRSSACVKVPVACPTWAMRSGRDSAQTIA